jgi:hypothetical protein
MEEDATYAKSEGMDKARRVATRKLLTRPVSSKQMIRRTVQRGRISKQ